MNIFNAVILGVIQGVTEFLPISSSGHLVLAEKLLPGFTQPGILFDVVLHMGTLVAVLYYFREKIFSLKKEYALLIIVGTLPAVVVGFLFSDFLEGLFKSYKLLAIGFIVSGVVSLLIDKIAVKDKKTSWLDAGFIGIFQAIAIVPSISRSGITILAGLFRGMSRKNAAEFSFLLSVPAILGANVLQIAKYGVVGDIDLTFYLIGFLASLLVGVVSIKAVFWLLLSKNFKIFAYYCIALGVITFLMF